MISYLALERSVPVGFVAIAMSRYYGSKSEIDAWFIKRKPTVYDFEDEVIIANREKTMSFLNQRREKLKASRGIFGSNGLDADAKDFFSFSPSLYPERPGQIECDYYMKTGECIVGESCNFHHPVDQSAPMPSMTNQPVQQNVQLTLAELPQRVGTVICQSYLKTGTCKYGITCRFNHPPPGEAIVIATVQGTSSSVGEEGDKGTETNQEPEQKGTGK